MGNSRNVEYGSGSVPEITKKARYFGLTNLVMPLWVLPAQPHEPGIDFSRGWNAGVPSGNCRDAIGTGQIIDDRFLPDEPQQTPSRFEGTELMTIADNGFSLCQTGPVILRKYTQCGRHYRLGLRRGSSLPKGAEC